MRVAVYARYSSRINAKPALKIKSGIVKSV